MVCFKCNAKRRHSDVKCTHQGCSKLVIIKKWLLCKRHYEDRLAPNVLREYVEKYSSPFPQNEGYFKQLAAKIRWDDASKGIITIRALDLVRYRAFGKFLQTSELPEKLTWHVINSINMQLETGKFRRLGIRSCLLELGNLLVEDQLMPDWNSYLNEGQLVRCLQSAPAIFLNHLVEFEKWASDGMLNPKVGPPPVTSRYVSNSPSTVIQNVRYVVAFLNWCVAHQVISLAKICPELIASYKETLFWKYECKECHRLTQFEYGETTELCGNRKCNAIGSYVKVRRLTRSSAKHAILNLRVFFNWAQLNDLVLENPLTNDPSNSSKNTFTVIGKEGQRTEVGDSIRRYDDAVVEKLCRYIVSPEAEPEEALVLYLIIFHLFTITELRNAKIPSLVTACSPQTAGANRAKDFEYLLLSPRKLTRGRLTPGRSGSTVKFPDKARSWLVPLLERYFEQRRRDIGSEYLFAVHSRARRHNRAVSHRYINRLVRRASLRVLSGTVNARDLRGTAAAIFAQRSSVRGSILTKLGYTGVRAMRFNYLDTFLLAPRPRSRSRL
jgi:hypothetical protein